ncbi:MAG TPA: glycosyltransferase family 4 protein [Candidatus Binatia bacterium]|nr:glycosyltransferase family 4 protein [Candidatus Binatia bacterium]
MRVLMVHPRLNPPGGGRAVGAWTLQALRERHHVDVLTWDPVDVAAINRHFGTSLRAGDFGRVEVAPVLRRLFPAGALDLWTRNYLFRIAQRRRAHYDVLLSTQNEADFGARGIQYIHFPLFHDPRINPRVTRLYGPVETAWYHRSPALMRWYFRACGIGAWFSLSRLRDNLTLVNSDWTGRVVAETHGVAAATLYPPVRNDFPEVAWADREHGFVCVGRIAPEKRIPMLVEILAAVRRRGHDIHLHIVGPPADREHLRVVQCLQREHASWVALELNPSHDALDQLLSCHQYGIHGRSPEHFGIAVGEMVNAGCIVFVPDDGGQVEIIGGRAELIYGSPDEAVEKIDAVLRAADRQAALRSYLATRRGRFSADEFMRQIRETIEHFSG